MTGVEFSLYVKAKLNRIDTSSWEDVRIEEVLFFATEALKKLSVKFDVGMVHPTIDKQTAQTYLASITKNTEISLLNNEQILPLFIKIKDVSVHVYCGIFQEWKASSNFTVSKPTADAGIDQTIQLPTNTVSLNGSSSYDTFSTLSVFSWSVSGGYLDNPNSITPIWTLPNTIGVYTATLTVQNVDGNTDSNSIDVTLAAEDVVITTFYNIEESQTFNKSNCDGTGTGSNVLYTVLASTYSSLVSQADADSKAQIDIDTNGQDFANANGTCTFLNTEQTGGTSKNDCASGSSGEFVAYTVLAGTYSSIISQADADQQATDDITANEQSNANANGTCIADPQIGLSFSPNPDSTLNSYTGTLQITGISEMDELVVSKTTPLAGDGSTALSYDGNAIGFNSSSFNSSQYANGLPVIASASDDGANGETLTGEYTFVARLNGGVVATASFTLFSDNTANP
jgi:hypothetical protein